LRSLRGYPRHFELFLLAPLLPCLSVVAAYYQTNILPLFAVFLIGVSTFVIVPKLEAEEQDELFLVYICSSSVSLLMLATLISLNSLIGWDINGEFYVFTQVLTHGGWNPFVGYRLNSVLSISVLPTIMALVSSLSGLQIFKFVFPLVYSIVPLVLYKIYRHLLSPRQAFVAAFFFISYPAFYSELIGLGREEIAELLLILALAVLFSSQLAGLRSTRLLLILLDIGIIASHYSIAFIYLSILLFSLIVAAIWRRTLPLDNWTFVLFMTLVIAMWYVFFVNSSILLAVTKGLADVFQGLASDLFSAGARPPEVVSGSTGFFHVLNRYVQYLSIGVICLGFVSLLLRKNTSAEARMIPLVMVGMFLAGSIIALPFFAFGLDLARTYHIALFFISPCFVYGLCSLPSVLARFRSLIGRRPKWSFPIPIKRISLCTVLLLYFLFSSGWVFAVTHDSPSSAIVDFHRMANSNDQRVFLNFYGYYSPPQDVAGARWVKFNLGTGFVCTDWISGSQVLESIGNVPVAQEIFINVPPPDQKCDIFFSYLNGHYGIWDSVGSTTAGAYDVTNIPRDILSNNPVINRIYSNGGSAVYDN